MQMKLFKLSQTLIAIGIFTAFSVVAVDAKPEVMELAKSDLSQITLQDKQIAQISKSLKNVIEENQSLMFENKELQQRLALLKEENYDGRSDFQNLRNENQKLSANLNSIRSQNDHYTMQIAKLQKELTGFKVASAENAPQVDFQLAAGHKDVIRRNKNKKNNSSDEMHAHDEDHMKMAKNEPKKTMYPNSKVMQFEEKTMDLIMQIDAFTETDEKLLQDTARAHYNMGNIYFQKGEYEIAAREYYQAVALMPDDADAHYNLAFVSGEHLNDSFTALKHFKMYLYLNPDASDKIFVNEKIVHHKLLIDGQTNSVLEKNK